MSMPFTFANQITILRILAVPFFIATTLYYSPDKDYLRYVALGIFVFAVVSDIIDGYIARVHKQETKAGAILDPLADKLLMISAFICLYKVGIQFPLFRFPLWLVVAVISRDVILLIGGTLIYMNHGDLLVEVTKWGKASTFFQVTAVLGMLLQWPVTEIFWYVAGLFVVISGMNYIFTGIKIINTPSSRVISS